MKTLRNLLLVFTLIFSFSIVGQKPEPVYSIIRQIHDFDWYEQQAKAWKQEIDNGTKDNMAWVYWLEANRMAAQFCDFEKWKAKNGEYFMPKGKIVELAEKAIPNSFELYFMKTLVNNIDGLSETSWEYALKAQNLRPYDNRLLPFLVNHYQFEQDKANIELTCKKWFESNEMPQEMLITAYNSLVSLDTNAILLTYGDNDTYPCWVLQYAKKIRPDVLVMSVPLATYKDKYRENVFKENGIAALNFQNDSSKTISNLFKHLVKNVTNRPIYVSFFASQDIYKGYDNKMYFTGLSLKYSPKPFNNLAEICNNVENKFLLDFLKHSFYNNYAESVCKMLNAGYVASFLKLSEYYKQSGAIEKSRKMKELAKIVATNSGYTEWLKYLRK